jgi:uncharacterized protein (DUF3820 family)
MTPAQQNEIYRSTLREIAAVLDKARALLTNAAPPVKARSPEAPRETPPKSNALDAITMPFGKHKGERVDSIDAQYLKWLWDKGDLYGDLAEAVKKVLEREGVDL